MKARKIAECMVRSPYSADPALNLRTAGQLMRSKKIRHLPVVKNDKLIGIVSDRDLKAAIALPQAAQLTLGDIMVTNVFVVPFGTSLANVAGEMAERKLGSALVVNGDDELIGIFTTTDALNLLARQAMDESIGNYFDESEWRSWPLTDASSWFATAFSIRTEE